MSDEGNAPAHGEVSLASTQPHGRSVCMIAALVVNVALLIYSHVGINAIVYSSLEIGSGLDENGSLNKTGQCTPSDESVWFGNEQLNTTDRCLVWDSIDFLNSRPCPYASKTAARDAYNDFMFAYGLCVGFEFGFCEVNPSEDLAEFQQIANAEWGFSGTCAECMFAQFECTVSSCVAECASNLASLGCPGADSACADCVEDKCSPAFKSCSGLPTTPVQDYQYDNCPDLDGSEPKIQSEECLIVSELDIELYKVFEVRFGNAVTKAWEGGARFLALLVAIASGVWPYMKNIMMAITWFVPLSPSRRDYVLLWLARLGRWSLVDVFAVILIIVGLRIDKEISSGTYLLVRSESSAAIYCFAVAAVMALVQGEVIRRINRNGIKRAPAYTVSLPEPLSSGARNALRGSTLALSLVSIALAAVGLTMVNIEFEMRGIAVSFKGPNLYKYTGIEVGTSLVDACQLQGLGEYFLLIVYFATVVLCPALALLGFIALAVMPARLMASNRGLVRIINVLANFQCLDVFLLSMVVLIAQFEPLIDGSIAAEAAAICGEDVEGDCLKFVGTLELGAVFVGASVVTFWAAQILSLWVQRHWRFHAIGIATIEDASKEVTTEWK